MKHWVIFDLGGVCLEVDQRRLVAALQELTNVDEREVRRRFDPIMAECMISECSDEEFHARVEAAFEGKFPIDEIIRAVNAELGAIIPSTSRVIEALQGRAELACLSNTNSIHWRKLLSDYPFMQAFRPALASQELGLAKPAPGIYERAQEILNCEPAACVFFDDRVENVVAAAKLGWDAHLYTGPELLFDVLIQRGLLESAAKPFLVGGNHG
jgi:putative hydrolase of the HAD superfamily